jgi:hypothetical protein
MAGLAGHAAENVALDRTLAVPERHYIIGIFTPDFRANSVASS